MARDRHDAAARNVGPTRRACHFRPRGRRTRRASKEENWFERIGLARLEPDDRIQQVGDAAVYDARYLDVVALPEGGYRIYYEARLPDESHELRTELIPPG